MKGICFVPGNFHTYTREGYWKFQGGGRSKANISVQRKAWIKTGISRGMGWLGSKQKTLFYRTQLKALVQEESFCLFGSEVPGFFHVIIESLQFN